ncbi:MAG TPA: hypothetical protein VFA95_03880 [Gammaproteobacteria bacterium]|nr:hypothetical protein [Gammaproteobacteria bacterium]
MTSIALQQVSSRFARRNAAKTLEHPIALRYVEGFLDTGDMDAIRTAGSESGVYVWGAKLERVHQAGKVLEKRCLVLFRRGPTVYKCGVFVHWTINVPLAAYLWGFDSDNETWGWIWFFKRIWDLSLSASEVNRCIGYESENHWQGLVGVRGEGANEVIRRVKRNLGLEANDGDRNK